MTRRQRSRDLLNLLIDSVEIASLTATHSPSSSCRRARTARYVSHSRLTRTTPCMDPRRVEKSVSYSNLVELTARLHVLLAETGS